MSILAIDPGTEASGVVWLADGAVRFAEAAMPNDQVRTLLRDHPAPMVAIEMIASYGMPVGREVFETCLWIGRFLEVREPRPTVLVYRQDVKMHLCQHPRAKDPNVRQALLDRFGGSRAVGTKREPGPLYGVKSHAWAALGVAVTALATQTREAA